MTNFFVIDTNVLISAAIKKDSVSRLAHDKAFLVGIVVRSKATMKEFAEKLVLSKFDKYLSPSDRIAALSRFMNQSVVVI